MTIFSLHPEVSHAPRSLRGLASPLEATDSGSSNNSTFHNVTDGLSNTPPPYHDLAFTQPPTAISDVTQQPQPHSQADPFIDERLGLIIFLVSTITSIALVLTMIVREYYFKRYGVDFCPLFASNSPEERDAFYRRRRADSEQHHRDWALAHQLQMQLNEEGREAERIAKRKERRKWYEYFLKPYCMTVQSGDIFYAHETHDGDDDNDKMSAVPFKLQSMSAAEFSDDEENKEKDRIQLTSSFEEEEVSENAKEFRVANSLEEQSRSEAAPVVCSKDEDDAHRFLSLPVKNDDGILRQVDAQCALCIDDYEEGDCVVWSDLQCSHAFHKECIMQWLSKGKKRCPVCRHWFVPGARIEDQKKLHGEDWERANAELTRIEDEQIIQDAHDREKGGRNGGYNDEVCATQRIQPLNAAQSSEPNQILAVNEAFCESNCPAATPGSRLSSEVSGVEQQQPFSDSTRVISIEIIEECTGDCCTSSMDIRMNISTETEEATDSIETKQEE